jgi:hypothetical protein
MSEVVSMSNGGGGTTFLGGVAMGAVLLTLAWFIVSDPNAGSHDQTVGQVPVAETSPSTVGPTQSTVAADPMQRCLEAAGVLEHPLRRASSSVAQWEVHVEAMNKLVVGAISLPQANAFWNRTRVGASHRIEGFERAMQRLHRPGVDCPPPALLPSGTSKPARSCARQVATELRVLHEAGIAIDTWRKHVHAMEMLRMGMLSPSAATRMWLAMWHRGQQEIVAYRHVAHAADTTRGCAGGTPGDVPSASASP